MGSFLFFLTFFYKASMLNICIFMYVQGSHTLDAKTLTSHRKMGT